ncbi:MAG: V-type ATPase subunit [Oscillospiraceae bacterium]|nr:V-type ATPase subunit [Oscillospiraceae bacterium]
MLRARESRMLTADRASRMLEASGFEESAKLLGDCGYDDLGGLSAAGVDKALSERRAAIFKELESLVPDRALVELFRLKYDYHNAKAVIKGEAMGVDPLRLMSVSGRVPPEKLKAAFDEELTRELPPVLGAAMVEAASVLARTANPQLADFELDQACFQEMKTLAGELDNPFLSGYVRLLIDAANLKSAVRTARMHKSADFLSSVLIKGGTDVDRIAAADGDGLAALFAHGPLEKAAAAGAEAITGGSMTAFELLCDNAVNEYLRSAKLVSYGPEVVAAYIAAVETEITAVRMILTGSLAGVSPETIRERLRDLYA